MMIHGNLRKVGGSVMLAVPPIILKELGLEAGKDVILKIEHGKLTVQPKSRPRYTLADLLSEQHLVAQQLETQHSADCVHDAWAENNNDMLPVGREEL